MELILGKVQVDKAFSPGFVDTTNFGCKNHFYYRMQYDPITFATTDAFFYEKTKKHTNIRECECCARIEETENYEKITIIPPVAENGTPSF